MYTYLAHHGIKGMKWGVRRFQNSDGSLTSEGVQRYQHGGHADYFQRSLNYDLKRDTKKAAKFQKKADKANAKGRAKKSAKYKAKAESYMSSAKAKSAMAEAYSKASKVDKERIKQIQRILDFEAVRPMNAKASAGMIAANSYGGRIRRDAYKSQQREILRKYGYKD